MNSKSISTGLQTQLYLLKNPHKNTSKPSTSPNISFNFKTPTISLKKVSNIQPNASADGGFYTSSAEETLYDLLGIQPSGTVSEIKRAYKQMALKYHPDMSPPGRVDEYTSRFIRVQEAYKTLSDPESRAVYDYNLVFSGKKGSRFEARSEERARWRRSWEGQVEELKRRSRGGRMTWAARIRKQRVGSDLEL